MKNKIAFIVPYPIGFAPSQRFRFEQYVSYLKHNNFELDFFPFLSEHDFQLIYQPSKFLSKLLVTIKGFCKRFFLMFKLSKYEIIFIHREATPLGPPIFEWVISKLLKKKIIYDFDDAIWLNNTSETNKIISSVKRHSKVGKICSWSSKVFCGNHYLKEYAKKFNQQVFYIPTTIDTENLHNQIKKHNDGEIIIGWTGTHTTARYLKEIESILIELQKKYKFQVNLICNKDPRISGLEYIFIPWEKESEIDELIKFDIGLMPLSDNEWTKGKCGFKALQYMALQIPAIASDVGVNNKIISDGVNGFLTRNTNDWKEKLEELINNKELRTQFGIEGRKTIINSYSVSAIKQNYLNHFSQLIGQ